jgi:hypothetical protein
MHVMRYLTRARMPPPKLTHDRLFQMRVSQAFLTMLDDWRRTQTPIPSRAEAVRFLVETAISSIKPRKNVPK